MSGTKLVLVSAAAVALFALPQAMLHAQDAPAKPAQGKADAANAATPPKSSSMTDTGQPVDKSGWSSTKDEAPKTGTAAPAALPGRSVAGSEMVPAQTPPRPGMVWADHDTKMYHAADSPGYGRTQGGKWMTEQEAKKSGYHAVPNQ